MKQSLIILIFLIASIGSFAQSKKVKKMTKDYLEVAFWKTGDAIQPLTKWVNVDTLHYHFSGEIQFMSEKGWNSFISEMEKLTGMKILQSENKSSNISIYFGSLEEYAIRYGLTIPSKSSQRFSNWSNRSFDANQALATAGFCIVPSKVQNNNDGEYLVQKLFIKSLGLLGELTDEYSLFYSYYNENNERPTRPDKRLIKLHYQDQIKVGMTKDEVQEMLQGMDLEELAIEKL